MPITPTLDEIGHKTYTGHFIANEDTRFLEKWILKINHLNLLYLTLLI